MKKWKTSSEIGMEVSRLQSIKINVSQVDFVGDNNHAAIDAQCDVLTLRMSMGKIYAAYGNEDAHGFARNVLDNAIVARLWMTGEFPAKSVSGQPSDEWLNRVTHKQAAKVVCT